jgi:hypothetical protein
MAEAAANQEPEKQDETTEVRSTQPRLPSTWWKEFVGKPVAIQLRDGLAYFGVTYPNDFLIDPEKNAPVATPLLKGMLQRAVQDGDDVRLVLQTTDPDPGKPRVKAYIVIHPGDVGFATFMDMDLIAR